MNDLTPKQDEIRTREARILALARPMVAGGGFAALSMNAIAKQMRYTKGTIYNHFACKEEILLALAIESTETRLALFDAAQRSESRSRDRMAAIGLACEDFRTRFADLFAIENMVRHSAVWDKASEQRRESLIDCEGRSMGIVAKAGRDAIQSGDLKLSRGTRVEDVCFGLWSLTYGGMMIDDSSPDLSQVGVRDTFAVIRRNCNALMDGYGWQPLYDAASYRRLVTRVRKVLQHTVPTGTIAGGSARPDQASFPDSRSDTP
jgi:AcrR family transcriptional regulator